MNWLRRNLVSIRLDLNPLSKCLSRFSKRTDISSPDNPKKLIEERQKNLKYKMAKLIIIIIQFTVMISLMCCGKKEKEIIFRQLDYDKIYKETHKWIKDNADSFRGPQGIQGEQGAAGKDGKDGNMPTIENEVISKIVMDIINNDPDRFRGPQGAAGKDFDPTKPMPTALPVRNKKYEN